MAQEDQEYQLTEKGKELAEKLAQNNIEKDELQSKILDTEKKPTAEKLKADLRELDKKIAIAKELEKQKKKEVKEKSKSKKQSKPKESPKQESEEPEEQEAGARDGRMAYREATNIRKKSFGTLLGEQEGGLGESLKKTISLKAKAKMTGLRETFDPMNIAKKLTFGSNLAPAIVGKMMGRKQEDIAHFTDGKVRGADTSSKIKPIDKEPEKDGMVDILTKILTLLQQTNENEKKGKEKQNNLSEEQELEKEKKRKEMLALLKDKNKAGDDKSAEKIEKETGSGPFQIIEDILNAFGGAKTALSLISNVGRFFLMNPIGLALLAGASLMTLLALDKNAEQTNKGIQAAGDVGEANKQIMDVVENTGAAEKRKQQILADRPSDKKSMLFWKDPELQNKYLEQIGFDEKTGLTKAEKEQGYNALDENGLPIKKEKTTSTPVASAPATATEASTESSSSPATATPVSPATNSSSGSAATTAASLSPNESVVPTAAPVASTNVGQKLNQAVAENNSAKLETSTSGAETASSTINNTTNLSSKNSNKNKNPILAVRNSEDTFQRMLMNSIRTV